MATKIIILFTLLISFSGKVFSQIPTTTTQIINVNWGPFNYPVDTIMLQDTSVSKHGIAYDRLGRGFFYWNGSKWIRIQTSSISDSLAQPKRKTK